ncbi:metallopeptidase TldD-related protein [Clostridiaceae bacterium M8S5]|nr:metallopeptidase TldD-related protein [Clostridiaceae bacterium M8S5]
MIKEKYIDKNKESAVIIANTSIQSTRTKDTVKTGIRIYDNGKIGIAGAIGSFDEGELEKEAIKALDFNVVYEDEPSKNMVKKLEDTPDIIKEDLKDEVEEVLSHLKSNHSDFDFSGNFKLKEREVTLCNDNNLDLRYHGKGLEFSLLFTEKKSVNIMDGYIFCEGKKYNRENFLNDIDKILDGYRNVVELPEKTKMPVIILHDLSESFVNKLRQESNGELYGAGYSKFSNKIGEKLFNEKFTIYNTFNPEDVAVEPFFDTEGVVNEDYRFAIIEEGVFKLPYTSKTTARKYNLKQTGSATGGYYDKPSNNVNITYSIKQTNEDIKELLKGEVGILIWVASGGDFTSSGDFSTPVQLAYLFDGEKIIGRLPEIQVSSNMYDMYGDDFRGVAKSKALPNSDNKCLVMDMNVSKL